MEKELGGGGKRVVGGMVEKGEILEERGRERETLPTLVEVL